MIQLQLEPEIEAELVSEAEERGLDVQQYVGQIVMGREARRPRTQAEREAAVQSMLDFPKKHGITLGDVDLKSLIHEGHKY